MKCPEWVVLFKMECLQWGVWQEKADFESDTTGKDKCLEKQTSSFIELLHFPGGAEETCKPLNQISYTETQP